MAEQIGVQTTIDNSQFNRGLSVFTAGLSTMTRGATATAGTLNKLGSAVAGAFGTVGKALGNIAQMTAGLISAEAIASGFTATLEWMKENVDGFDESLQQISTVMWEVLRPSLEVIAELVGEVANAFLGLYQSGFITAVAETIADFVRNSIQWIRNLISTWGDDFTSLATNAFNWGLNFIASFASGIVDGIGSTLQFAIDQISAVLSYFFSPGSPPKIAPDIDKWGASAMNEFLGGFLKADFGMLQQTSSMLSSELWQLTDMTQVQDALTKAQEQYNATKLQTLQLSEKEKSAWGNVEKAIGDYNSQLGGGASRRQRKDASDKIKASFAEYAATKKARQQSEANEDTLKATIDLLKERLALLEKEQKLTQPSGGGTTGGGTTGGGSTGGTGGGIKLPTTTGGKAGTSGGFSLPTVPRSKIDAWKKQFSGIFDGFAESFNTKFAPIIEKINNILDMIGFDNLIEQFNNLADWATEAWDKVKIAVDGAWKFIQPILQTFSETMQSLIGERLQELGQSLDNSFREIKKAFESIDVANIETIFKGLGLIFTLFLSVVVGVVNGLLTALNEFIKSGVIENLVKWFVGGVETIGIVWQNLVDLIDGLLTGDLDKVFKAAKNLLDTFVKNVQNSWNLMSSIVKAAAGLILGFISGFIDGVIRFFENLYDELVGNSIIPDMLSAITNAFTSFFSSILSSLADFVSSTIQQFSDMFNSIVEIASGLAGSFSTALQSALDTISGFVSNFYSYGQNVVQGLIDGVGSMAGALKRKVEDLVNSAIQKIKELLGIASPSELFMEIGTDMGLGLSQGLVDSSGYVQTALDNLVNSVTRGVVAQDVTVTGGGGTTVNNNYNLALSTMTPAHQVQNDFSLMRTLWG